MNKNIPYVKEYSKETGKLLNPIIGTYESGVSSRSLRRGHSPEPERKPKRLQLITMIKTVDMPIFGHPAGSVPNIGYNVSTHYNDGMGGIKPYTIQRKVYKTIKHY